jgi:hypothetical protein
LGYLEVSSKIIDRYMETHVDNPEFFDLSKYPFPVPDPELREAFDKKFMASNQARDPVETLLKIAKGGGWSQAEVTLLAGLPSEWYYDTFKLYSEEVLRSMLTVTLQFDKFPDAIEEMQSISRHAIEALTRIGRESPINERRVHRYGVVVREEGEGTATS